MGVEGEGEKEKEGKGREEKEHRLQLSGSGKSHRPDHFLYPAQIPALQSSLFPVWARLWEKEEKEGENEGEIYPLLDYAVLGNDSTPSPSASICLIRNEDNGRGSGC